MHFMYFVFQILGIYTSLDLLNSIVWYLVFYFNQILYYLQKMADWLTWLELGMVKMLRTCQDAHVHDGELGVLLFSTLQRQVQIYFHLSLSVCVVEHLNLDFGYG